MTPATSSVHIPMAGSAKKSPIGNAPIMPTTRLNQPNQVGRARLLIMAMPAATAMAPKAMEAKAAELERIRCRIDALRDKMHEDAFASASLHGLLAYEKRVQEAQEWPFDQTTLVRVCASALILTVPWFGQAAAAYMVDHLSRIGG